MLADRVGCLFWRAAEGFRRNPTRCPGELYEPERAQVRGGALQSQEARFFSAGDGVREAAGTFTFSHEEENRRKDNTRSPTEALASVAPYPALN
jgi:hypothetical protein